jgi:two-component system, cell cycle sensor histidine kinase and response regulator CckA
MNSLRRSPLFAAVFALGLTALALVVCSLLRSLLHANLYLPFLAVVWLCAWYHGRPGGVVAVIASAVSVTYFFVVRDPQTSLFRTDEAVRIVSFAVIALSMTWVTASWRDSRNLLASTLAGITEAVVATGRDGRITFLNQVAETLLGWPAAEARGKLATEVLRLLHEQTRDPVENPLLRALRERVASNSPEPSVLMTRSGAEVTVEHTAGPVRDGSGALRGAILVLRDIGARRNREAQLTHSQKMDAVERLAGGVAGDFNNVLTVITGYADLLRDEVAATGPLRRFVDEILYASERATVLTRHLLAFSRGTSSQPRVFDLNLLLNNMEPMLHRLLGQNTEFILLTSPELGCVKADPSQLEQVVVNLVTNARDAMQNGGKLVVETANVDFEDDATCKNLGLKPGCYVMLAVSDTGAGMDAETRSRLFEPFFTTKSPGKGSGLGLATVYGIVKQSDGQVTVYSQPGCGTIFEIYLPRIHEAAEPMRSKAINRGSETILLVDDEEGVRKLVFAILQSNGYDVLEASNGPAALSAYEKNAHKVDMVLTDVVMPQMNGFELGTQLGERAPKLKILYMSGYRDNPIGASSSEAPRLFLHKPFTPDALLSKVRELLDQ